MLGPMQGCYPRAGPPSLGQECGSVDGHETQLVLTVVRGSDPISGRIRVEDDAEETFYGYLQLVAVLERVRTASSAADGDSEPAP